MSRPYDRQDHFYERAKAEQYRSRAAYKLIELDNRFRFLRKGSRILDLGAWPGSWTQVAAQKVGEDGIVVAIDRTRLDPLPEEQVHLLQGDLLDEASRALLKNPEWAPYHAVISDMSPKLTGIKELDQAQVRQCADLALDIARELLAQNGTFVVKLFHSPEADLFAKQARSVFKRVTRAGLDSTRKSSSEWYFVGQELK